MINQISVTLLIISSFLSPLCLASAADDLQVGTKKTKITWLVEDKKENINLLDKVAPTTSVASYIESRIISKLTQYDIELKRVNIKRIDHILQNEPNACAANRAKLTSREKYSLFSSPQAFYLTHKLFRYDAKVPLPKTLFNKDGDIKSLVDVFKHQPDKTIGIAEGISFGSFLDEKISQLPTENIHYRGGNNRVVALEAMLYAKRVDFLLALPIDIKPTIEQKARLEQHSIEGAPPYLIAYFSCSKGVLGEEIINNINRLLSEMYQTEDYSLAHKVWFGDKELTKLQRYLKDNFSSAQYLLSK